MPAPEIKNCSNCEHKHGLGWRPRSPVSEGVATDCLGVFYGPVAITKPSRDSDLCFYKEQPLTNCSGWQKDDPGKVYYRPSFR